MPESIPIAERALRALMARAGAIVPTPAAVEAMDLEGNSMAPGSIVVVLEDGESEATGDDGSAGSTVTRDQAFAATWLVDQAVEDVPTGYLEQRALARLEAALIGTEQTLVEAAGQGNEELLSNYLRTTDLYVRQAEQEDGALVDVFVVLEGRVELEHFAGDPYRGPGITLYEE